MPTKKTNKKTPNKDTAKKLAFKAQLEKEVSELESNTKQPMASAEPDMPTKERTWRRALLQEIEQNEKPAPISNTISSNKSSSTNVDLKYRLAIKKASRRLWYLLPILSLVIYSSIYLLRLDKNYSVLTKYLPWPVAIINNKVIWLDELNNQVSLIAKLNQSPQAEAVAFNHMLEEKIIQDDLSKNNLAVPKKLIDQQLASLSAEFGTTSAFYDYLNSTYEVTVQQFINFVLEPYLRRVILHDYLSQDASAIVQAETKANDLRQKIINESINFETAAREFSDDSLSAPQGGDLGWFSWGTMLPEFESALRQLNPGEISQPIKTQYGYHLIRLEEINGSVPNFSETSTEVGSVHASHIFIQFINFNNWIEQKKNSAFILRLLPLKS